MNYNEAIDYINNINMFGSKHELKRIKNLLNRLNNPQDKLKIIHIAGTNGKGSTCAMLESILINSGYNIGLYTSPHLIKYNERFRINKVDINDEEFANLASKVAFECLQMVNLGEEHPTIFEFLTAMAFCYFYYNNIDIAIIEVGLGGRYDATNIISSPILSIITSIGIDHVEYLGDTLEKISMEKAGIIKNNCPTVLYFQSDNVYNIIKTICNKKNSKLYYTDSEIIISHQDLYKTIFSIKTNYYNYDSIILNMIGEYQIYNSATVLLAIEALRDVGINISKSNVLDGLNQVYWKGRMEVISTNPYIILDGAHNIDGIKMLSEYIKKYLRNNITLIIGLLKDKEYQNILDILIPLVKNVIITQPNSTRALNVNTIKDNIKYNLPIYTETEIYKALTIAKEITKPKEIILCVGSLYLIGELKKFL